MGAVQLFCRGANGDRGRPISRQPGTAELRARLHQAILPAIWYVMGAEDRFLVQVYRKHVEDAAKRVVDLAEWEDSQKKVNYRYVGEIEATAKEIRMNPTGWRVRAIGTTTSAAVVPLLVLAAWIGILIWVN